MLEKKSRESYVAKDLLFKLADELGIRRDILLPLFKSAQDAKKRVISIDHGNGYVKGTFVSSAASRKRPERVVVSRSLDGELVKHRVGVPIEKSYHHAVVGVHSMKCTCEFALMVASKADKLAEALAKTSGLQLPEPYPFSRRVLCKHTLVLLDELLKSGVTDTENLTKTVKIALVGYAVAKQRVTRRLVNTMKSLLFS